MRYWKRTNQEYRAQESWEHNPEYIQNAGAEMYMID